VFEKKEHQNSGTLGKDTINNWIIPFLSVGKRGFKSNFDLATIFLLILKRLKTGVQWRELPNDLYEIEEVLKEILALLGEAGIEHKGLFLNVDAGFESKSLRDFLESKEIIANIKPNPRNGE